MSRSLRRAVSTSRERRSTLPASLQLSDIISNEEQQQPPPPTEQPPPPSIEMPASTANASATSRDERIALLLERARKSSLGGGLSRSGGGGGLERGSSYNEKRNKSESHSSGNVKASIDSDSNGSGSSLPGGEGLKRSVSYREPKSPRTGSFESTPPTLVAQRGASSGSLPTSPRDISPIGIDKPRSPRSTPPLPSPRGERRASFSAPSPTPDLPRGTNTRIIYMPSPMAVFMHPPKIFIVPNEALTAGMRAALMQAHASEFGVGHADGFDEASLKADAVFICDAESMSHTTVKRQFHQQWPGQRGCLCKYVVVGVPDAALDKRSITHEYIFKHPI